MVWSGGEKVCGGGQLLVVGKSLWRKYPWRKSGAVDCPFSFSSFLLYRWCTAGAAAHPSIARVSLLLIVLCVHFNVVIQDFTKNQCVNSSNSHKHHSSIRTWNISIYQ